MCLVYIGVFVGDDYLLLEVVMCVYLVLLLLEIVIVGVCYVVIGIVNLVLGDQICMINCDWVFLIEVMCQLLGFDIFVVFNDFVVLVYVLLYLFVDELEQVGGGVSLVDVLWVLFGVGMGLGVVLLLLMVEGCYIVVVGEGGYVVFLLMNDEEVVIWCFVCECFGYVLVEWLILGMGLELIYEVLGVCFDFWQ